MFSRDNSIRSHVATMPVQGKGKRKAEDDAIDSPLAKKIALPKRRLTQRRSLDSLMVEYAIKNELHCVFLSEEMLNFYFNNRQKERTFRRKDQIRQRIARLLRNHFDTDVYIVGSSVNDLGVEYSDLDITIEQKLEPIEELPFADEPRITNRSSRLDARMILRNLKGIIRRDAFATDIALISNEDDWYLRFTWRDITVKVFVNKTNSVRSSKLLRSYTKLDRRVAPLIVVVKRWGLTNTTDLLSGYSLSLMAIHFLQSGCSPAVLPSLQILAPDAFNSFEPYLDNEVPEFISENDESIGKLLFELFEFYSYRFRFSEDIISVREGQSIPKPVHQNSVFVEEPFDGSNTISNETDESLQVIHKAFRSSLSSLALSGRLHSLF